MWAARPEVGRTDGVELLEQVQLVCPRNSFGAVTDTQLAVGIRDVTLDGGQTDEQMIGNLVVPHSLRNETQDLDLPSRQWLGELSCRGLDRGGDGLSFLVEGGQQSLSIGARLAATGSHRLPFALPPGNHP